MPLMTGKELNKEFIHYGHICFRKRLFEPVANYEYYFTKPIGGLWGSPIDGFGFKVWCEIEGYEKPDHYFDRWFKFKLTDDAKIFVLDGNDIEEIKHIPSIVNNHPNIDIKEYFIDFKEASKKYDAIFLANEALYHYLLYGWDCDSILIMNPDVVDCFENSPEIFKSSGEPYTKEDIENITNSI